MELKKGYKQTGVGVIPNDWEVKKLGEFITINSGESPSRFNIQSSGVPYFKVEQLNSSNKYLIDSPYHIETERVIVKGSIIFPKRGASILLNKIRILEQDSFMDTNLMTLTLNEVLDVEYVFYLLSHYELWRIADTTSIPQINNKHINPYPIPVPAKSEQTAIATALSDADALITSIERLIAKKRNIKQGAMQQLLKPKKGWVVRKLGDVLKIRHGKGQKEVVDENGNYPILGSGGVMGKANMFLYDKPSVLIGRKGTIDQPQYMDTPFWTVDTLFYSEIFEENDAKFIFYIFNLIDWYNYNEASGVPSLNAKTIENIERSFPEKKDQTQIATILTDMDNEIAGLKSKLEKSKRIKQGMMQNLLTGKIRLV